MPDKFGWVLFAWFLLVAGVVTSGVALRAKSRFKKQVAWTQTPGVITLSEVKSKLDEYIPVVRYDYTFQSQDFTGDTVRSGNITYNWSGPAERLCARYPIGARVSVHVDPANPSQSVLEPGGHSAFLPFMLSLSASMIIVATLVFASE